MIKKQHQGIATVLALAILPLSGFAADIYLPSLPGMTAAMQVSSLQIQLTITVFLISYGVSQLFIGSILDSYGRFRFSMISLVVFAAASFMIANTHNIYVIYAMRVVHGITIGFIIAGKRAFFVDVFEGEKLKSYLTMFSIIWSAGPIVAPFVGGYLQANFGWESNFYALGGVALAFALLEFIFSGETLAKPMPFRLKRVVNVYAEMLGTGSFVLGIIMMGLAYAMVMVYNMTGPFIIEHHLQYSAVTAGYCSLIQGFAWMIGGFISKATIDRPFFRKLAINKSLQLLIAILMLASAAFIDNLYSLVFFAFLIHVGAGFTFNNYMTVSMTRFPKNAGIASGLTGGFTYIIVSTASSGIVSLFPARDAGHLSYSYLILILTTLTMLGLAFRTETNRKVALPAMER
ncbi:MAG TPA: MFS transporter [Puia sp.]|nr:MFS transporter [Puia sp.]